MTATISRSRRLTRVLFSLVAAALVCAASTPARAQAIDPALLADMDARSIGPAGMSGRVADVDVVVAQPDTILVGSATGGVWKSEDSGLTWRPIFDDQPVLGIGAVAFFQPNPDIIWVGTGEGNPRNSMGVGAGVYKSMDGGETWTFLGLRQTERIHRIIPHPTNPDIAYVGAMGPAWSDGEQRGVFKTTDGGQTWERVLYVNESTGVADLVMDPVNPQKLFAAMWEFRRWPWFFESGGPGSGLYVTYDGGENWRRLTAEDGLPEGELGRIGVAIARTDPEVVYALVEAEQSALLRSDDGGESWRVISDDPDVASRPFYYADIRVDPQNENRVFNLQSRLLVSEDAGRNWETLVPSAKIHGDIHDVWLHPDGDLLINANDGGIGISYNGGETWRFVENLPISQFYEISVDMEVPFNIYGGMQDNGSWVGPSQVWEDGGVRNYRWIRVGGGDGFGSLVDAESSRYGFSMSQGGDLMRFDKLTGKRKDVQPASPDPDIELRFNWNAAIARDPLAPGTIYLGSQFVHKTTDDGDHWTVISPDLTTDDPAKQRQEESGGLTIDATGAENHTTIVSIAPSPVQSGVIWVGTDDGNVQVTRNGGESWTNTVDNLEGVPAGSWVSHVEADKFDAAGAYAVIHNYQRGDWGRYVYRTENFGESWTRLALDGVRGFARVIEQDPVDGDILYLGTEFGLYVTLDRGAHWFQWTHGLPSVPVHALVVHPRDHDLVIATHGRGAYILDDVRPLRELSGDPAILARAAHVFEVPPAYLHQDRDPDGYRSTGDAMFFGENRPYGALISYVAAGGDATVAEAGDDGAGMNRDPASNEDGESPGGDHSGPRAGPAPVAAPAGTSSVGNASSTAAGDDGAGAGHAVFAAAGHNDGDADRAAWTAAGDGASTGHGPASRGGNEGAAGGRSDSAGAAAAGNDHDRIAAAPDSATLEILDGSGTLLRTIGVPSGEGLQRVVWDLRREGFRTPGEGDDRGEGPEVLPGTYTVRLRAGGEAASAPVQVRPDPRVTITRAERQEKFDAILRAGRVGERWVEADDRLREALAGIDRVRELVGAQAATARKAAGDTTAAAGVARDTLVPGEPTADTAGSASPLMQAADSLQQALEQLQDEGQDVYRDIRRVYSSLQSSHDAPTEAQQIRLNRAETELDAELAEVDRVFATDVTEFRRQVEAAGLEVFAVTAGSIS